MIAEAAGVPLESISDAQLADFKMEVSRTLTPHATAVLLDPEYGIPAMRARSARCGLLATYEADGYENPRPHRMLALMPQYSVRRLAELGAQGIKILLSYTPDDDGAANEEKCVLIERIGYECDAAGIPFFLEPVVYDPAGQDPKSFEFARRKPDLVVRTMQEFSKPTYRVDVLKVEFPVNVSFVGGTQSAYSIEEALDWYRKADSVARLPYIYLSAGVSSGEFLKSLRLAAESGARFSGVLCGRANWQDGVPAFAKAGGPGLRAWLETEGVENMQAVNDALRAATPWQNWFRTPSEQYA